MRLFIRPASANARVSSFFNHQRPTSMKQQLTRPHPFSFRQNWVKAIPCFITVNVAVTREISTTKKLIDCKSRSVFAMRMMSVIQSRGLSFNDSCFVVPELLIHGVLFDFRFTVVTVTVVCHVLSWCVSIIIDLFLGHSWS